MAILGELFVYGPDFPDFTRVVHVLRTNRVVSVIHSQGQKVYILPNVWVR